MSRFGAAGQLELMIHQRRFVVVDPLFLVADLAVDFFFELDADVPLLLFEEVAFDDVALEDASFDNVANGAGLSEAMAPCADSDAFGSRSPPP